LTSLLQGSLPFTGELLALGVAFLWGLAAIIWTTAGEKISATELNLIKVVVASGLVSLTLFLTRIPYFPLSRLNLALMSLSGMIGIGIGDIALFTAFQKIGPTRASMIKLLSPLLVSLVAFFSLGEKLGVVDTVGMAITLLGIVLVVSERLPHNQVAPHRYWEGVGLALLATLGEVIGVIFSHQVLVQTPLDPLWATLLRLASASVFLALFVLLTRQRIGRWLKTSESSRLAKLIGVGVFCGTFIGLWLQQSALKMTAAGVAQTIFSSTPLFILLIQAVVQRHWPSARALGGVLISLVGVSLIFLGI
jgi:drug/metabolite transporter (DMT)-like permease